MLTVIATKFSTHEIYNHFSNSNTWCLSMIMTILFLMSSSHHTSH